MVEAVGLENGDGDRVCLEVVALEREEVEKGFLYSSY
jgi:hypothetical protein